MKAFTLLSSVAVGVALLTQTAFAGVAEDRGYVARYLVPPHVNLDARVLQQQAAAGKTVPFFTNTLKSPLDGNTYQFRIVGTDPTKARRATTINYAPVALRIHFPNGVVLDPTQPGCGDTVSVVDRFFRSPLFEDTAQTSNGVNVGTVQLIDALQRAEFWQMVQGTNYHVRLASTRNPPLVIDVAAPAGSSSIAGACAGNGHNLGMIDQFAYDTLLHNTIAAHVPGTATLPIIMAYNTVLTSNGTCCIIGYHSFYSRNGGSQVYSTGAYTDAGIFNPGIEDIHAWTHEIGETFNDPFILNATPPWGHVGQQSGCQNNLEVGDPLTGTPFIVVHNGFTYHPQENAFFSWFFRTPSSGTGNVFSYEGTFTTSQGVCH